jgi:hypothetical protein
MILAISVVAKSLPEHDPENRAIALLAGTALGQGCDNT